MQETGVEANSELHLGVGVLEVGMLGLVMVEEIKVGRI